MGRAPGSSTERRTGGQRALSYTPAGWLVIPRRKLVVIMDNSTINGSANSLFFFLVEHRMNSLCLMFTISAICIDQAPGWDI